MRTAILAAVLAAPRAASAESHVISGELVRVSLTRRSVGVKLVGPPPREVEVRIGPETVLSSRGRTLRLADLRTGERVLVSCTDEGGVHGAQRVKLGGRQR